MFRLTSLLFPKDVGRSDVLLSMGTAVDVTGVGEGSIAVNARNLDAVGSFLSAGIGAGLGAVGAIARDITLNATEDIKFVGSGIFNVLGLQAVGSGGNINISTSSLSLTNGAQLSSSTFGQGNAGNINITATSGILLDNNTTSILSIVGTGGKGNGGNIRINSGSLFLTDGAALVASTFDEGNGGNINIDVKGAVTISGRDEFSSGIFTSVGTGGKGNGGSIRINGGSLFLTDGAALFASTFGEGVAGGINIDVKGGVITSGVKDGIPSTIASSVGTGGKGNGRNIRISSNIKSGSIGVINR